MVAAPQALIWVSRSLFMFILNALLECNIDCHSMCNWPINVQCPQCLPQCILYEIGFDRIKWNIDGLSSRTMYFLCQINVFESFESLNQMNTSFSTYQTAYFEHFKTFNISLTLNGLQYVQMQQQCSKLLPALIRPLFWEWKWNSFPKLCYLCRLRDKSGNVLGQWGETLQYGVFSHRLSPYSEWSIS